MRDYKRSLTGFVKLDTILHCYGWGEIGKTVNRYLGYGSLGLFIGWLVLSYTDWLPVRLRFAASFVQYGDWFQQVTIAILLLFVSIQLWLLGSTVWVVQRRRQETMQSLPGHLPLSVVGEFFWTVLPLFLTIGLALVGYQLWASL